MAGLDDNVIFSLVGDTLTDDYAGNVVLANGLTEANIEDSMNGTTAVKCININSTGFLNFTMDSDFLNRDFTVDWWEMDLNIKKAGATGVLTNISVATGGASLGLLCNANLKCRSSANLSSNGSSYFVQDKKTGNDQQDVWVHRALVYDSVEQKYKFYENGEFYVEYSGPVCKNGAGSYNNWLIGRFRTTGSALMKKIYNLRVSDKKRWSKDFKPQVENYSPDQAPIPPLDVLPSDATTSQTIDVMSQVMERMMVNEELVGLLAPSTLMLPDSDGCENTMEHSFYAGFNIRKTDFNKAIELKKYVVNQVGGQITNAPTMRIIEGYLENTFYAEDIEQKLVNVKDKTEFVRYYRDREWSKWEYNKEPMIGYVRGGLANSKETACDFNEAIHLKIYKVNHEAGSWVLNSPGEIKIYGYLYVYNLDGVIFQELVDVFADPKSQASRYKRYRGTNGWNQWQAEYTGLAVHYMDNGAVGDVSGGLKDFNQATTPGNYWFNIVASSTTANKPSNTALKGLLKVEVGRGGFIKQSINSNVSGRPIERIKPSSAENWTPWVQCRLTTDSSTLEEEQI